MLQLTDMYFYSLLRSIELTQEIPSSRIRHMEFDSLFKSNAIMFYVTSL